MVQKKLFGADRANSVQKILALLLILAFVAASVFLSGCKAAEDVEADIEEEMLLDEDASTLDDDSRESDEETVFVGEDENADDELNDDEYSEEDELISWEDDEYEEYDEFEDEDYDEEYEEEEYDDEEEYYDDDSFDSTGYVSTAFGDDDLIDTCWVGYSTEDYMEFFDDHTGYLEDLDTGDVIDFTWSCDGGYSATLNTPSGTITITMYMDETGEDETPYLLVNTATEAIWMF